MKRYRICVSVLAAMLTVSTAVFVTGCNTPVSPDNPGNTPGDNTGDNTGGDSSELPVGNGTATITENDFPAGEFNRYEITWTPAGGEKQPKLVASRETVIIMGLNPKEKYTFTVTGVSAVGEPKEVPKTIGEKSRAAAVRILESTDFNNFAPGVTHVDITWTPKNTVEQPLRVSLSDATKEGVTSENFAPGTYTFTLQGMKLEGKTVTPEIVKPPYSDLLEAGYDALEREDYDSAVASFMAAYEAEANNETKMHAALARLAAISVNEKVVTLMRERIGFASYPRTLNALINTDEWWSDQEFFWESYDHLYTYQEVSSESGWGPYYRVSGDVIESSEGYFNIYCKSEFKQVNSDAWVSLSNEKSLQKIVKENEWGYWNYTLANPQLSEDGNYLIDSSTAKKLDIDVSTNSIYLSHSGYVSIDYKIKDFMYYPELTGAPDWVSNVSLYSPPMLWMAVLLNKNLEGVNDLIDSVLNNVFGKSYDEAVQLINSMDNEPVLIDGSFIRLLRLEDQLGGDTVRVTKAELKAITAALDIVKGTLQFLQAYNLDTPLNFFALDWIEGGDIDFNGGKYAESYDPFNNGFLTRRSGYTTETAVNTYISALDTLIEAYESITADNKNYPSAAKDFLKKYSGYKDLAIAIKAAIQNKNWYDFPSINNEGIPQLDKSLFRINFGCMKDGFFSMDKLFETKDGKPVFRTREDIVVNAENKPKNGDLFGPVFNSSICKEIWTYDDMEIPDRIPILLLRQNETGGFGMDIFNFYYGN